MVSPWPVDHASTFIRLLRQFQLDGNQEPVMQLLRKLPPAAVDSELRSMEVGTVRPCPDIPSPGHCIVHDHPSAHGNDLLLHSNYC